MRGNVLTQGFWNFYALCYDALVELIPYQQMMADVAASLELEDGMTVMIAGCGTGNLERYLLDHGFNGKIVAVDFSSEMLRIAGQKNPGVTYAWSDLSKRLDFEDRMFDRIASVNVLYTLPDPEHALTEMTRVLKEHGKMVHATPKSGLSLSSIFFSHLRQASLAQWVEIVPMLFSLMLLLVCNLIIFEKVKTGHYQFFSKDEVESLSSGYGLSLDETYSDQNWLLTAGGMS